MPEKTRISTHLAEVLVASHFCHCMTCGKAFAWRVYGVCPNCFVWVKVYGSFEELGDALYFRIKKLETIIELFYQDKIDRWDALDRIEAVMRKS